MAALTAGAVRTAMVSYLEDRGLNEKDIAFLQLEALTAEDSKALSLPAAAAGFRIPYFYPNGKPNAFFRVRYLEDTRTGFSKSTKRKPLRYGQPPDTTNSVYLAPYVDWPVIMQQTDVPLLITEGEVKAAAATRYGIPTLGLGGVWCFQSSRKTEALLPQLREFDWKSREVFITYDSDAVTNPDVLAAEARLASRLNDEGAIVHIARLKANAGSKIGLDDWLVQNNFDVKLFQDTILDLAEPFTGSSALHAVNMRCVYVRDPGFVFDRELRQRLLPHAFVQHAFANLHHYEQRTNAKGGTSLTRIATAKAWLEWPQRAECRGLVFTPGAEEVTDGYLNTWAGWGVPAPIKGPMGPWHQLMLHLFGGDGPARKWFEQWLAYPIQNPGAKMATAVLLWGRVHGSGKTLIGHTMMRLYGSRHSGEIHDDDLENTRNEWAMDKCFILADDIVAKGDRKLMRHLMTLVTRKTMRLDPKYIPSYAVPDCINYYYTSNDPDAFYLENGDRRFFIHEVMADKYTPFRQFCEWRDSDAGIAALWQYLLGINLSDFDPQAPAPETSGKREMMEMGKSDLGTWCSTLREAPDAVLLRAGLKCDLVTAQELHHLYDPTGAKRTTANALARELKRAGFNRPGNCAKLKAPDGSMKSVFVMRNPEIWAKASWANACKHYALHHPLLSAAREKF